MRPYLSWSLAAFLSIGSSAVAQDNPVVVELFTSQGCSSCPPADALLAKLGEDEDVIPLALHVDYWDYIGWKDSFADARFTKRQKGYARNSGRTSIFTPQMVINGAHDVIGNRPKDVSETIKMHQDAVSPVTLDIAVDGEMLRVSAEAASPVGATLVYLVRYTPHETVSIRRGENAGRKISYSHIVTDWDVIGHWDGQGSYKHAVPFEGDAPAVVLVQEDDYGAMLAAARLR